MGSVDFSLIIPVYKNEGSIPELVQALEKVRAGIEGEFETVFVVDGSPDRSFALLRELLPKAGYRSQLLLLSRNYGSFSAIRAGLSAARGRYFGVMAADLQEPVELPIEFRRVLARGEADIVFGRREGRDDAFVDKLASNTFWWLYRKLVQPEMPPGGVDVFGCNQLVRDQIVDLHEANTSLVGLLLWLGFRREFVPYTRAKRRHGRSAWTFAKKLRYLLDSFFAFSDKPIRVLSLAGMLGMVLSITLFFVVLVVKLEGRIPVPGYAATVITVVFFGGLNSLGLGVIGEYVWRAYENTKKRPNYVVRETREYSRESPLTESRSP